MDNKGYIQNLFSVSRHCEEQSDEAIFKSLGDCHVGAKAPPRNDNEIAVLLVNFGGPATLSEVKPFLYNLFSDPTVLNFPFVRPDSHLSPLISHLSSLYRKPLAYFIANVRSPISSKMYKRIGGASPLISITHLQAEKLKALFDKNGLAIDVFVGFRYSKPYIVDKLIEISTCNYKKIVVLPLYPQYSYTTTGSVQLIINDWLKKSKVGDLDLYFVSDWYRDEDYIQSYVNLIKNSLDNLDLRQTEILFSAHSIPYLNIKKGDPYQRHIIETAQKIIDKLNWKKRWHIAYQSKIGPTRWLEPATQVVIKEIAKRNPNVNILVVPISFVCEHVETTFEIDILYKEVAKKHGIKNFVRVEALNTDRYLIQALYNQVIGCLENNQVDIKELLLLKR